MQNIVSPSLALLLMLYIFYPQYILLSHPTVYSIVPSLCLPQQSWCYHTSFGHDQPPSLSGLHNWSSVTLNTRGEIISLQMIKKVTVPDFLYPWLWSQQCRQRFCLRQMPRRRRRHESSQGLTSSHSGSFGVPPRWLEKTNKNQYAI